MATAEASTAPQSDEATRIIALLDAARGAGVYVMCTLFAHYFADGVAEHVFRLWASANNLELEDRTSVYNDGEYSIRSLSVKSYDNHISLNWPRVDRSTAEVREPAPGVVIHVPDETWRPGDEETE